MKTGAFITLCRGLVKKQDVRARYIYEARIILYNVSSKIKILKDEERNIKTSLFTYFLLNLSQVSRQISYLVSELGFAHFLRSSKCHLEIKFKII